MAEEEKPLRQVRHNEREEGQLKGCKETLERESKHYGWAKRRGQGSAGRCGTSRHVVLSPSSCIHFSLIIHEMLTWLNSRHTMTNLKSQ